MKLRWTYTAAVLLASMAAFSACDSAGPSPTGAPTVKILLTDAPGDIAQAVVVIDQVALLASDGSGTVLLRSSAWEGDLLELRNNFITLAEEQEVAVGHYNELRLRIPNGCIRTEDGQVFATQGFTACGAATGRLQMPSFAQSGLKIKLPPEAEVTHEGRTILLDFNVAESFGKQRGNSNMWVMHPVVRATDFTLSSDVLLTVNLADGVTLPDGVTLAGFGASLDGNAPLALQADGTLRLRFLVPGAHAIGIVPPEGWVITTDPVVPHEFNLPSNTDLPLTFTIVSIAAAPPPSD